MADPAAIWCNTPDHANLIATVGEQSRLIGQLFAKIQNLENKLEIAQQAIHNAPAHQNPTSQAPNLATPGDGYVHQQDYSPPAPSAHDTRRAQARGQPCNYGSNCTRENCWYEHPGSRSAESSNSSSLASNQSQPTNGSTRRINQECKNGVNCTRKQCWFEHPSEWVPPNRASQGSQPQMQPQPQPAPQPQSSTEPPAAEVDSWGTSQDLSSWGTTSTNDWSTPADNTWGAPTQADNGWGNTSETSWNTHASNQHNPPAKNSRSASTMMSREGSVSNSSTNRSQGRGRKARGKGRRADSESIATESTPMSPAALAPTPHVEPIPAQIPLPSPTQSADQASSLSEFGPSDEINTPSLESWGPSSSPEPEAPGTPKASWSDEPNIDVVYFPDPPLDLNESQPSVPEGKSMDLPEDHASAKPSDDPRDLAPSDLYSSWGTTTATASDWGLDPNEFPDPSPTADHTTAGKKSKSKGKQRETFSTGTNGRSTPRGSSLNPAAQSETSLPANEPQESEPVAEPVTPDPPQGVPHEEIPDWLLGADEDAHAALGIPRPVSPKPNGPSAPPRLAPTNPAPRPPLSKLAGENFPSLSSILPTPKPSQSKDTTPSGPTFSPRPVGWKITRTSDTSSSSGRGKGNKPKDSSNKK